MNLATAEKEKIVQICECNNIEFCAVFGSFARGEVDKEILNLTPLGVAYL